MRMPLYALLAALFLALPSQAQTPPYQLTDADYAALEQSPSAITRAAFPGLVADRKAEVLRIREGLTRLNKMTEAELERTFTTGYQRYTTTEEEVRVEQKKLAELFKRKTGLA